MSVTMIKSRQEFQGLSTDDKPPKAAEGATYHSVDTGEMWIMCNRMWSLDLRMAYAFKSALRVPLN